jgi:hypothetical protein
MPTALRTKSFNKLAKASSKPTLRKIVMNFVTHDMWRVRYIEVGVVRRADYRALINPEMLSFQEFAIQQEDHFSTERQYESLFSTQHVYHFIRSHLRLRFPHSKSHQTNNSLLARFSISCLRLA